ncbi:MAG: DUF2279 domain-containing protein [Bacteroidia bacterium]
MLLFLRNTLICGMLFIALPSILSGQEGIINAQNDSINYKGRQRLVTGTFLAGYAGTMTYLSLGWYSNTDLGPFHFFDDSDEWLQMDKVGHVLGGYTTTRYLIGLEKWAGVPKKKALLYAGIGGFMAMNSIEVLDGFAVQWGASWSDIAANAGGVGLALGNHALWGEERIQLKFSYLPSPFTKVDSLQRLFGSNPAEWLLKDYNGQTYWLSFRMHSFLPEGSLKKAWPSWLNLAAGYGGEGMIGRYGIDPIEQIRAREYRQYYLGLDIDFQQIKTSSEVLKFILTGLNFIKIPLPAIRFDRQGVALRAFQ